MIRIDKGIRIKPGPRGFVASQFKPKYPWRDLKVSESFLIPIKGWQKPKGFWNTYTSCKARAEKKTGFRFTSSRVRGGIRVWRVA